MTLLDNLGFTDNYIECMIPTSGVYPIATANDKSQISAPLMSRFAVIDIPDYTPEKKVIFSKFALPKILKRMSLKKANVSCHQKLWTLLLKNSQIRLESVIWSRLPSISQQMHYIKSRLIMYPLLHLMLLC